MNLINKLNNTKQYWKHKEEEHIKLDEYIKSTLFRNKPCIHYKITDYFSNIKGYNDDRYIFARSIFRNFLNTEPEYDNNFNIYDTQNNDNNFTYCNICSQQLLCNHIKLGASYIEEDKPINYNNMISIYTEEINGGYYCKACNEFVDNTEVLDIDDFAKGEDARQVQTREITEDIPIVVKKKQYVDNFIQDLVNNELTQNRDDLQYKIKIYNLMKNLCGLDKTKSLTINDDIDILNFLKSYNFTSKVELYKLLSAEHGVGNITLLKNYMERFYIIFLCCDIAARFLIILQTAQTPYELYNRNCNNTNIIGYPLINDESDESNVLTLCTFP